MTRLAINPDELGQDPALGIALAHELGIACIELRTAYSKNILLMDDAEIRALGSLARRGKVQVAAIASPLFKWCDPGTPIGHVDRFGFPAHVSRTERPRHIERAIEIALFLEAPILRIFSGINVGGSVADFLDDPLLDLALEKAANHRIILALENEPVCAVASFADLEETLRWKARYGLRLWLDLGNLFETEGHDLGRLAEIVPYAAYVQVKDYRRLDGRKVFCAAGQGEVPYADMLRVLLGGGRPHTVAVETHVLDGPAEAIRQSVQFLRGTIESLA